jgi:hypothetical protein
MYCQRCGRVLDTFEQRIGYCRDCDVPRLLEEIRNRMGFQPVTPDKDGIITITTRPIVRQWVDGVEMPASPSMDGSSCASCGHSVGHE